MKIFLYQIKSVLSLLTTLERKKLYKIAIAVVGMTMMELLGVVSIFPFMTIISNPNAIYTNEYLKQLYILIGFKKESSFLLLLGFSSFVALVVSNFFRAFSSYLLVRFAQMQSHYLSMRVFKNYLSQPYEFFLHRNSADLTRNVVSEVGVVVNGVLIPLLRGFGRLFSSMFIVLVLIFVDPVLALNVTIILGCSYLLIYKFLRKKIDKTGKKSSLTNKQRVRIVSEARGGVKEIKLLNCEQTYLKSFELPSLEFAQAQTHNAVLPDVTRSIMETIAFGGVILIVLVMVSKKSGGDAIAYISLYAFSGYKLMPSLQELFNSITKMKFSIPALDVLRESLNMQSFDDGLLYNNPTAMAFEQNLELKDLTFHYLNSTKPALENVNLSIRFNTSIGIIGPTGSGKTTLVDLILGLLKPSKGAIFVDGIEINDTNLSNWQKNIGYVPQSIYLADDTIFANIAFGIPADKVDFFKVKEAARMAQIDDFIETQLPEGYRTLVGERGVRLSGGQRQRIGIARALYYDPKLIVFDEATSALDSSTEAELMSAIEGLQGNKTIIMIAHRLSTIRKCDQIIKIENGYVNTIGKIEEIFGS